MSISITDGEIKGAKTYKRHTTEFDSEVSFTLFWEIKNTTRRKLPKKRRIWYKIQQRGINRDAQARRATPRWFDIVSKEELCAGQKVSDTIEAEPTSGAGAIVDGVRVRLEDFRIVISRKTGSGKRQYEACLRVEANSV